MPARLAPGWVITRDQAGQPTGFAQTGTSTTGGGTAPLSLPPIGFVRLRAVAHDDLGLVCELNGPINPTGYGGYTPIAREGKVSLTGYQGRDSGTLPLGLLIDRWQTQMSIEAELEAFERMAGALGRPPALIVEGRGLPRSHSRDPKARWVMTGEPAWNEVRTRQRDGVRVYADIGVVLMRFERPDPELIEIAGTRKVHEVKKGSELVTLNRIARHYRTTWTRLRQLNTKLSADPDRRLKVGTRVRVT